MGSKCLIEISFIEDVGFNHIKDWLQSHCCCEENQNYFNTLTPIHDLDKLKNQLSHTDELFKALSRKDLIIETKLKNISKSISLLDTEGGYIEIDKLAQIKDMASYHIDLVKYFKGTQFKIWRNMIPNTSSSKRIIDEINRVLDNDLKIKHNASKELKKICQKIREIDQKIETTTTYELNKYIKLGYLRDNKTVFRSGKTLLPVNTSNKNKVKGIIDSFSSTHQTCFIQPISVVELNNRMNELLSEQKKEVIKILIKLTADISTYKSKIEETYDLIKYYDIHATVANFAIVLNAIKPQFKNQLILKDSINPLFSLNKKPYVPLNISIKDRSTTIVISGPNSGGKTIVIKSIGLYAVMAQCGLYIPASTAILPMFRSFLSDIGDKQSLNDDLSTFSAHMKEIAYIIKESDQHSLIIIDEMGTGTDPDIGSSLSVSILKKLTNKKALNLCTTHLTPLKVWADENSNAENGCMEFDNKKISPTFIFKMGLPGSSYGIEIANRMGIEKKIITDASSNLNNNSFKMEELIKKINQKEKIIVEKIFELNQQSDKLKKERTVFNSAKKELEGKIKEIKEEELLDSKEYIKSYRKKIESLIENIKRTNASRESIKQIKSFVGESLENIKETEKTNLKVDKVFSIGDYVQIKDVSDLAIIIDIDRKSKNATLQIDEKRITAKVKDLVPAKKTEKKPSKRYVINSKIEPLQSQRLDIRGKRVDEAIFELDKFLDRAILSNLKTVDILHGKGTGALQEAIHSYLSEVKFVENFNFAPIDQGGAGITIVEIS